jgi:hypothetical protein
VDLLLNYNFEYDQIDFEDVIQIFYKSELLYTWIVWNITRRITNNFQEIEIPLLWFASLFEIVWFKQGWFKQGWSYVFNKNQDPAQTLKDIIDVVNLHYNYFDYTQVENFGSSVSIDFNKKTCLWAINDVIKTIDRVLFVDRDWKVYFKDKPVTPTHLFTVWKDIENIELVNV